MMMLFFSFFISFPPPAYPSVTLFYFLELICVSSVTENRYSGHFSPGIGGCDFCMEQDKEAADAGGYCERRTDAGGYCGRVFFIFKGQEV